MTESYFRGFLDYIIEVLSKDTDFIKTYVNVCDDIRSNKCTTSQHVFCQPEILPFIRSKFLLCGPKPWIIPSGNDLAQLDNARVESFRESLIWKRIKWRFSAAAVAIEFFISLSQQVFSRIRNVVLHEDQISINRPECHGLGLIPSCLQNLNLQNEVSQERRSLNYIGALSKRQP